MVKRKLTNEAKRVMFEGGTEAPFSGQYVHESRDGIYSCNHCGLPLFESSTKYDSNSGWPSFTKPIDFRAVTLITDNSLGMERVEVRCARCDGHLGHVFEDGPVEQGGDRYCINSVSLTFSEAKK